MLKLCLGYILIFLIDTLFCVKLLVKLIIFIHADILVLVSEFVVLVILSLSGCRCRPLLCAFVCNWTLLSQILKWVGK